MKKCVALRLEKTTIFEWLLTFKKFKVTAMYEKNGVFVIKKWYTNKKIKQLNEKDKMLR